MKKTILFLTNILCATLLLFSFTGCRSNKLFSERTLRDYDIPWLTKPENATEETQQIINHYYDYQAYVPDKEAIIPYAQSVLDGFTAGSYVFGYFVAADSQGGLWDRVDYYIISPSSDLNDYIRSPSDAGIISYSFFYTAAPLDGYDDIMEGYRMLNTKRLNIHISKTADARGLYECSITLIKLTDHSQGDIYRIPEEAQSKSSPEK